MNAINHVSVPPPLSSHKSIVIGCKCVLLFLSLAAAIGGCSRSTISNNEVARGVTFVRDINAGVQLLDVDLLTAPVRPSVVAENVSRIRGNYVGDSRTVIDWAERYKAIGGLNAGYFGETYDQLGTRKQIVGLAVVDRTVVAPISSISPNNRPDVHIVRSAIGFRADGTPAITWATGASSGNLKSFESASVATASTPWDVASAVSCGPSLFHNGARHIDDHEEWLVSPGKLPRAFVAFDRENGRPRHLVIGRADAMEFTDVAAFLTDYFAKTHHSSPREAMCLDGGPSAQLVYRANGALVDVEPTGVLVPTAILLVPEAPTAVPYFPPAKAGGN